jgi:hypothetical protein
MRYLLLAGALNRRRRGRKNEENASERSRAKTPARGGCFSVTTTSTVRA